MKYSFPIKFQTFFFLPEFVSLITLTEPEPQETKGLSIPTKLKRFYGNSTLLKLFGTLNPFEEHKNAVKNHISFLNILQKIQNVKGLILQPFIIRRSHWHRFYHSQKSYL